MINEKTHLKISFASLARGTHSTDRLIDWKLKDLTSKWATFALEEDESGQESWRCLASTFSGLSDYTYGGFKKGAVYEAESGARTVCGARLSAEKYLSFLDSLPLIDIANSGCTLHGEVLVPLGFQHELEGSGSFTWDQSKWEITDLLDGVKVRVPLDDAQSVVYFDGTNRATSIQLKQTGRSTATPFYVGFSESLFAEVA